MIIMVALWNRADHYIFMLWFVFSSFLLSSPNLIRRRLDVCHTSTHGVALVRIETCCTRFAENTGRKKVAKNRHLGSIAQICRAISSQLRHVSTIGKKRVKQQYVPTIAAEIGLPVWGSPANFNGFHVLAALLHGSQVVSVSQTLRR